MKPPQVTFLDDANATDDFTDRTQDSDLITRHSSVSHSPTRVPRRVPNYDNRPGGHHGSFNDSPRGRGYRGGYGDNPRGYNGNYGGGYENRGGFNNGRGGRDGNNRGGFRGNFNFESQNRGRFGGNSRGNRHGEGFGGNRPGEFRSVRGCSSVETYQNFPRGGGMRSFPSQPRHRAQVFVFLSNFVIVINAFLGQSKF